MIKKSVVMSVALGSAVLAFNTSEVSAAEKGIVTASALNLRSGAGTNHSVVGKAYKGNSVEILETSNGWHKIKLSNGSTGWASSQYISLSGSSDNSVSGKKGTVNASALNVRSGAGTNHSVVGKAYKGNSVEILESSNGWHKVKLSNGTIGWASSQYITIGQSDNAQNGGSYDNSISGKKGTVNASALNVRSGASTNHSVVGKAYKGNSVEILETSNGWSKVKLSNGTIGWASSQYITVGSQSDDSQNGGSTDNSVSGKKGTVNTSALNVRSGAGTNHSVVAKAYKGNSVEILETSNGWSKIKLSNGTIGWASSQYITVGGESDNSQNGESSENTPSNSIDALLNLAKQQVGKPYVWGAEGPNSFDCSGLIYYVYKNAAGVTLPRVSRDQANVGTTISRGNIQPGDLLFSSTDGSGKVNHVGIYIGNDQMVHAPKPGDTVKITNMNTSYWNNAYLWAKRVI